jgi:2-haloalkanoic acid dehalogenase type II
VLFDLGNTLEYCNMAEHEVFNAIFRELGSPQRGAACIDGAIEATREDFHRRGVCQTKDNFYGFWLEWDSQVLARLGVSGDVERYAREIHARWFDNLRFHIYAEVPETLRRLRDSGLKLAVVSNGSERELEIIMKQAGLDASLFDAVVGADTFGSDKPDRRIFEGALRLLGVAPGEAAFVGDKPETDGGAAKVGMRFFWLDRKGKGGAPEWSERIESLAEMPGLVRPR